MKHTITIGSAPYGEECPQVGTVDYATRAQKTCRKLIELLRVTHGLEPDGCRLTVKSNAHDYGSYYEVSAIVDDTCEAPDKAFAYAMTCESGLPEFWRDTCPSCHTPDAKLIMAAHEYRCVACEHQFSI